MSFDDIINAIPPHKLAEYNHAGEVAEARRAAVSEPDGLPPIDHHERRVNAEIERLLVKEEARRRLDIEARGHVKAPEVLTLRERLARPRQAPRWRIGRWQPYGSRVVLAAQYKSGKTTLVNSVTRSLVDGDPFLGCDAVTPITGCLTILDTEMSATQSDDWLRDQNIRNDDRVIPILLKGDAASLDLLDDIVLTEWATRLRALKTSYLVLDNLRPILDALGLDEHHDVGRFLVAFDALLAGAGIPEAIVVHHMGHIGERSRGDSRLRDWPDVEWRMVRQDEDPASPRFITAFGRDVDVPESQLTYDASTRRLTLAGGSRRDTKMMAALDVILPLVKHAPLSGRAIKTALAESDIARDVIDSALHYGVRNGLLTADDGPKHAKLYSPTTSVRVSGSVRPDTADALDSVSECPDPYIDPDTRTLPLTHGTADRDTAWALADARFKSGWRSQ